MAELDFNSRLRGGGSALLVFGINFGCGEHDGAECGDQSRIRGDFGPRAAAASVHAGSGVCAEIADGHGDGRKYSACEPARAAEEINCQRISVSVGVAGECAAGSAYFDAGVNASTRSFTLFTFFGNGRRLPSSMIGISLSNSGPECDAVSIMRTG